MIGLETLLGAAIWAELGLMGEAGFGEELRAIKERLAKNEKTREMAVQFPADFFGHFFTDYRLPFFHRTPVLSGGICSFSINESTASRQKWFLKTGSARVFL